MHIHIYAKAFVDTVKFNKWDKTYFLKDNNPRAINNVDIKCNRTIEIHPGSLRKLLDILIYNPRSYWTKYVYLPNGQLDQAKTFEHHGHIILRDLNFNFQNRIRQNAPNNYFFCEVGLAVNSKKEVDWNGRKRGNIEIKYHNPAYPNEDVILNLHIAYVYGKSIRESIGQINNALFDFEQDIQSLSDFRDSLNLDNFDRFNLDVDPKSMEAVESHVGADFINALNLRI